MLLKSVPFKELYTAVQALYVDRHKFEKKVVLLFTDSITNVFAFAAGSSSSLECHRLLRCASSIMRAHEFSVLALWLPREYNVIADSLSKGVLLGRPLVGGDCVLNSKHAGYNF